jgi:hypothetical protein
MSSLCINLVQIRKTHFLTNVYASTFGDHKNRSSYIKSYNSYWTVVAWVMRRAGESGVDGQ